MCANWAFAPFLSQHTQHIEHGCTADILTLVKRAHVSVLIYMCVYEREKERWGWGEEERKTERERERGGGEAGVKSLALICTDPTLLRNTMATHVP